MLLPAPPMVAEAARCMPSRPGRRPRAAAVGLLACGVVWAAGGAAWLCGRPAPEKRQPGLARNAGVFKIPGDVKNGAKFLDPADGKPYEVQSFVSKKIGKGIAKTTIQAKNIVTGASVQVAYGSGTTLEAIETTSLIGAYTYFDADGDSFMFMDTETYEEKAVPRAVMGQLGDWLTEGVNVYIEEYDGKPIFARLEPGTELIAEVEIAQGSTGRSDGDQQVTYTNGVTQAAPAYIKAGDKVLINQREFCFQKRL